MRSLIFAIVILTANVASAQIIASQQEGPAVRSLPQVIQQLSDDDYAAWAKWHNQLAEQHAEKFNTNQERYQRTLVTTYGDSGRTGTTIHGYRNRRTGEHGLQGQGSFNSSGTSYTYEMQRRIPGQVKGVHVYNPFCKPKATDLEPDWDNIFCVINGSIFSVSELIKLAPVPTSAEQLYEAVILQLLQTARPESVKNPQRSI
jgi:hypothetical protein